MIIATITIMITAMIIITVIKNMQQVFEADGQVSFRDLFAFQLCWYKMGEKFQNTSPFNALWVKKGENSVI